MHPCAVWMEQRVWHTHPCQSVRATYALVSCSAHRTRQRTCHQHHESQCECFRPLHTMLGLYPMYRDTNSLVVKSANNNNSCSKVSHHGGLNSIVMMFCVGALRVLAQHVHSSLTSWTVARVQIDRGDGDLQSLWPASSDMSQLICCCCIAVIACGIGLFHMARASSRLTSVHVNIILGTHTLCVSACLPLRRALT